MKPISNIDSTVISSRIRLARNLAGFPFPNRICDLTQALEIIRLVHGAARGVRAFNLYYMSEILEGVALSLRDDHLISAELIANKDYGAALIDEGDEEDPEDFCGKVSIMINEEDHLREQLIVKGLNLSRAYQTLSGMDDELSKTLRFAFDGKLGYLTACPTNLGTGLRASVMLFLPGLTRMKKMKSVISEVSRLGHTVRGVYGEGSAAEGYMYQISNEVTLGVDEEYILSEVQKAVLEIVNLESHARRALVSRDKIGVKDACRRALGILTHCERISFAEFIRLISEVKLGAAVGFVKVKDISLLDDLIAAVRPANLSILSDGLSEKERDVLRAQKCRETLQKSAE